MSEFTDAEVVLRGTSRGIKESRNERGQIVGHSVQLVKRNAKNTIEVISVRLPDGSDPANYADGKRVELPVDISSFEGNMYYRATSEAISKPAETPRASSRPAAAS